MKLQDELVRVSVEGITTWAQILDPNAIAVDPETALREVLREFEDHPTCYSATAWVHAGEGAGGRVLLYRHPRRVLQVIGTSMLAEHLRELLDGGVAGWMLHPMPATRTLLKVTEPILGSRIYNLLTREGFTTVEELAASPDEALLEIRNLASKSLDAIHRAVATHSDAAVAHPSAVDTQARRREHIDALLSPAHRVRNVQLLELLVRSSVPLQAVDTILASLEAEPIPPVDPTVTLLLRTADEPELAALYERARQAGPEGKRGHES